MPLTKASFAILRDLAENNNREWYETNKESLTSLARAPFGEILEAASLRTAGTRFEVGGGPKTMFRQFRDVRFSKDKTPYKKTVSGILTPSGDKRDGRGLVFAQIDANGGFIGAGLYKLATAELGQIRDAILSDPDGFDAILADLAAENMFLSTRSILKTMPRGYAPHASHRHADVLRLKSFLLSRDVATSEWIDGNGPERIAEMARISAPLRRFCDAATGRG